MCRHLLQRFDTVNPMKEDACGVLRFGGSSIRVRGRNVRHTDHFGSRARVSAAQIVFIAICVTLNTIFPCTYALSSKQVLWQGKWNNCTNHLTAANPSLRRVVRTSLLCARRPSFSLFERSGASRRGARESRRSKRVFIVFQNTLFVNRQSVRGLFFRASAPGCSDFRTYFGQKPLFVAKGIKFPSICGRKNCKVCMNVSQDHYKV